MALLTRFELYRWWDGLKRCGNLANALEISRRQTICYANEATIFDGFIILLLC